MTKELANLQKFFLGFETPESLAASFDTTSYPRVNIVHVQDYGYRVEVALPGWEKDQLSVSLHKGILTVKGTSKPSLKENETYIFKGLSEKSFTRNFGVSKHIKLEKAYMEKGFLFIELKSEVEKAEKPVEIEIG